MERAKKWMAMTTWLEKNDIQFIPDFSKFGDKADDMMKKYQQAWKDNQDFIKEGFEGEIV